MNNFQSSNLPEGLESCDERSPLNLKSSSAGSSRPLLSRTSQVVKTVFVVLALLSVSLIVYSRQTTGNNGSSSSTGENVRFVEQPDKLKEINSFDVQMSLKSSDYAPLDMTQFPWDIVAEPFKEQTVLVTQLEIEGIKRDLADFTFHWFFNGKSYSGRSFTFKHENTGVLSASLSIRPAESRPGVSSYVLKRDFTVAVKYLRRELRTLTEADRKEFFDALQKMYTVDAETGTALYGDKFKTAEQHLWSHLNGAGTSDCDHWHDGAGIVTHHIAYTLQVEQTLQAINPRLSMPYWEFPKDAESGKDYDEAEGIFSKDWFGEANPQNADHAIRDGSAWEKVTMPDGTKYKEWDVAATGTLNPFVNAFGVMRSPWNNNPSSSISRCNLTYHGAAYKNYPDCSDMRRCFQSSSLSSINDCVNGYTHGPVHILIGGAWNEGSALDGLDYLRSPGRLLLFKIMWRTGYTRCPEECDLSDADSCKCAIPQEYIDKYGVLEILKATNIYWVYEKQLASASDEQLLAVLRAHEDPGRAGEMFTSAASFDPTFWPLHGAAERMLSYKRMLIARGDMDAADFDETWGYPTYNQASGAAYLSGVCDWSGVKNSKDLTLPVCDTEAECPGHGEDDLLEFSNFLGKGETYTNKQMYDFVHPWNEELPYVYDTYAYDYCEDIGVSFLESISTSKFEAKKDYGVGMRL